MPGITQNAKATAKLVKENDVLDHVAPAGGLNSGDVVQVAGLAGVVLSNVLEGEFVGVDITRTFEFPNPDLISVIGTYYGWDATNKKIVAAGAGDFDLGMCVPTTKRPTGSTTGDGAHIALRLKPDAVAP